MKKTNARVFVEALKKALEPTIKTITIGVQETLQEVAREGNALFKQLVVARNRVQTGAWSNSNPVVAYTDDPNKLNIDFDGNDKTFGKNEVKNVGTKPFKEVGKIIGRKGISNLKDWAISKGIYQSDKDKKVLFAIARAFYNGRNIGGSMFGVSGSNYDGSTKSVFERNIYDQVAFEVVNIKNVSDKLKINLQGKGLEVK